MLLPPPLSAAVLLAYLPDFPTLGESFGFQLNGLIVVMLALSSIWGTLELIGLYFKRAERLARASAPGPAAPTSAETASAVPATASGLAPETVAVIAAAVYATVGGRFRIHAVTPAELPVDWAREGRREIFASHRLR
jgi:hypothetical protein